MYFKCVCHSFPFIYFLFHFFFHFRFCFFFHHAAVLLEHFFCISIVQQLSRQVVSRRKPPSTYLCKFKENRDSMCQQGDERGRENENANVHIYIYNGQSKKPRKPHKKWKVMEQQDEESEKTKEMKREKKKITQYIRPKN